MGITDSTYDARIDLLIPHIEADFEAIREASFEEDSNDDIIYPDNAERIASEMIAYKISTVGLNNGQYNDKQSESIGGYSYTRGKYINGYPEHIVSGIEKYQRAHP